MSVNVDYRVARSRNLRFRDMQHALRLKISKVQFHFARAFRRFELGATHRRRKYPGRRKQPHTLQPAPSIHFAHVFLLGLLGQKTFFEISAYFFWLLSISFTFVCQNGIKGHPMNRWTIPAAHFAVPLTTLLFSSLVAFGQSTESSEQTYSSPMVAIAKGAEKDFTPDGNLSKETWKRAEWVKFEHDVSGQSNHPSAATRVAALWTDRYVYFAFWCRYDSLNLYEGENIVKERWELWNRDVAEVFMNPQPERISHYYEFEVAQ